MAKLRKENEDLKDELQKLRKESKKWKQMRKLLISE